MMLASWRIRRQLARTGDVVRWASIVAGPSEFWTITVWRSRHDMQEFMRSGAHDHIMWLFSRWLRSFWLMRWRPGPAEIGAWRGLALAQPDRDGERGPAADREALERALDHLPRLKAATAADGAARYESTPYARRRREEVGGAGGAVVALSSTPLGTLGALRAVLRLRQAALRQDPPQRAAVGVGRRGEAYLLVLWRDRDAATRFMASPELRALSRRFGDRCWANEWRPENEFGHWDGLRLRRARQHYGIAVPAEALAAADPERPGPAAGSRKRAR